MQLGKYEMAFLSEHRSLRNVHVVFTLNQFSIIHHKRIETPFFHEIK